MTDKELPEAYVKITTNEDRTREVIISAKAITAQEALELFRDIKKEMHI
jgi:hypothetical protein